MAAELDHLFIWTPVGATEAGLLTSFGLTEGTPNVHAGQGTANRRFFFANAMLELLWVSDAAEVQSEPIRPTHLWERWAARSNGACPFGICFRPAPNDSGDLPFSTWLYRPPYLPLSLNFAIAKNAHLLTEPMLCYLAFNQRPDRYPVGNRQPLAHSAGLREITRVELISPHAAKPSPELQAVIDVGLVGLQNGTEYLLELGFDGESQAKLADFRPGLPLRFRW